MRHARSSPEMASSCLEREIDLFLWIVVRIAQTARPNIAGVARVARTPERFAKYGAGQIVASMRTPDGTKCMGSRRRSRTLDKESATAIAFNCFAPQFSSRICEV
jgi:hypothetical protein